jgi:hypothetical protein
MQSFHGGEDSDYGLVDYDTAFSCRWLPLFEEI